MRIENINHEKKDNIARVTASVIWEDNIRPSQEIYFETINEFADDLTCNPHAFLLACAIPAMHHGEERVKIDEEICPELKDGLNTAMSWIRHWYYGDLKQLIQIESKTLHSASTDTSSKRAGFFFSGGVDSLATLRVNRLNYPDGHPGSIKDGLLIGGLEVDRRDIFERVQLSLKDIADDADITMVPVYTNLRNLNDDWHFWGHEWQAAALASVAHIFNNRLSLAYIAASDDISSLLPLGSHPLIDHNYGSIDLRIKHDGITLTRFDKTKLLSKWDMALQNLRVCTFSNKYPSNYFNCGECEKCIRTMLTLLALKVLDKTRAFPRNDVSEELIMSSAPISPFLEAYYYELIGPLLNVGRDDLVRAIHRKIVEYRHKKFRDNLRKRTIEPIKELDIKLFGGKIKRVKKMIFKQKE